MLARRIHDRETTVDDDGWLRTGLWLVGATLVYNVIEAFVAVYAGMEAGSIALIGFGMDSAIEVAAATALLWRLSIERSGTGTMVDTAEARVHRFIGGTFLVLASYVSLQAAWTLWNGIPPLESPLGIALAAASLVIMPLVAWGKLKAARNVGSDALRAEARETLACSYLSLALLVGLVANAVAGWWWADPIAALLMVPWLVREGLEGLSARDEQDNGDGDPVQH